MTNRIRAHVFIEGNVQGVFFRASTRDIAKKYRVDGWVRNLDDGRVEAVFEGQQRDVENVIAWCRVGTTNAHVDDVSVTYEPPNQCEGFRIRR